MEATERGGGGTREEDGSGVVGSLLEVRYANALLL
jgi:hypothetical protein